MNKGIFLLLFAFAAQAPAASASSYEILAKLARGPELSWVDSFSFGPEGKLYAVVNRLHRSEPLNGGELAAWDAGAVRRAA